MATENGVDSKLDSGDVDGDQTDGNNLNVQGQVQDTDTRSFQRQAVSDVLTSGSELRRSTRDRQQTERMADYMKEEGLKRETRLLKVYEHWKSHVKECKFKLKSNSDIESIGALLDNIKQSESDILKCFDNLRSACTPSQSIVRKVDACIAITLDMLKIANDHIAGFEDLDLDRLRSLKDMDRTKSIFGSTLSHDQPDDGVQKARSLHGEDNLHRSDESVASGSNSTHVKERLIDAAADLADKEAELKAHALKVEVARQKMEAFRELIEEETEYNWPLSRNPLPIKQESLPVELNPLSVKQEPCTLGIKSSDTKFQQKLPQVSDVNLKQLNVNAPSFKPSFDYNPVSLSNPQHLAQQKVTCSGPSNTYVKQSKRDSDSENLAKALAESVNLNRLPVPEPNVFHGDPLQYMEWKTSFEMLISRKGVPPQEKIFYLKKYVGDNVRKALEGFFYSGSVSAYDSARKVMDERYGHPFILQKAFRGKLDKWPKIGNKDPLALRDFADFLRSCRDATPYVSGLNILNDCIENQKLITKLPDWASVRWNREVTQSLDTSASYPTFSQFVEFVTREARIACNPVSSLYALNVTEPRPFKDLGKSKGPRIVLATDSVDVRKLVCEYCSKEGHLIFKCKVFLNLTIDRKRDFVRKKELCFGCLRKGHRNNECKRKHTCGTCKGKHPTCMHEDRPVKPVDPPQSSEEINVVSSLRVCQGSNSTSMIVPVWISTSDNPSREVLTYALLDTQSDTSFILDETVQALNVNGEHIRLSLSTMTSQHTIIDSLRVRDLRVRGFNTSDSISVDIAYTRSFIPADRTHIPVNDTVKNWDHLKSLENEVPPLQSCEVGLLIGYNCPLALAPRKILVGKNNEPYAVQTLLGWSVVGYSKLNSEVDTNSICHRTSVKVLPSHSPKDVIKVLEMDFAHDKSDDVKFSQEDIAFLGLLEKNIRQCDDKHLEMPLPFKERPVLPNNKPLALLRLDHLKRRLKKDSKYHVHYKEFMSEIISRGDAELVTSEGQHGNEWYIPHHGVYHPKKVDKLRVVFDCSAKYKDASLNQHLLTGPDLTNGLAGVLCRFRRYPIAVMCDVEKMFHQFIVPEADRNFLRFLWWENGDINDKPQEYRMRVHLFGAASSPGCANYGLKYLARTQYDTLMEASSFVQHNFYVDDGLASVETEQEAMQLIKDARELCANGGLRLHKFISNSKAVIESIPVSERASDVKDMDLTLDQLPVEHALGVQWCINEDIFSFKNTVQELSPTRRNMLSAVASIFDPLGFLSPFTLKGKRILQEMCQNGVGWNDPLPTNKRPTWEHWIKDIENLKVVKIPRCLIPQGFGRPTRIELHHFSDASTEGYGQCSYARFVFDSNVNCILLIGKARVATLKVVTIPRLELTAAVLSVKVGSFLRKELDLPVDKEYYWTDSKVVLGYISNESRRFHIFVANRVQYIRDITDPSQWFYVDTRNNPADHASRGLTATEITSSNWLTGPSFLWEPEICTENVDTELQLGDPEVRSTTSLCTKTVTFPSILDRLTRFSCWSKAVSIVSRLIRLSNGIKGIHSPSVDERVNATSVIVALVQLNAFRDSIEKLQTSATLPKSNPLYPLDPVVQDGMLRVGGRLRKGSFSFSFKHPVILPKNGHITRLIIAHAHKTVQHQGRGMTLNMLRSLGYWVVGGSKVVASFIRQCVVCRKLRRPTETQRMTDLPKDRVDPSPPFVYCGMDCFGPFMVKQGRKEVKRYGLLFTCMCSRAIHIEMLDDMSTDAFINGLRCFIAIRGAVRQIRSDQGSNFIGAKNKFERSTKIQSFLAERQCDFILNTPDASHTGGVWERQIRTVRNILNSVLQMSQGRLDDSSLRTVFYEVASIVNCRPLTVSNINDPKSLEPLTPNHVLTAKPMIPLPPPGEFIKEDLYLRKRWKRVQYLLEQFWSRWRKEYLAEISLRQKWHHPRRNICTDDIVLVKDVDLPRNQWPLARVIAAAADDDGLVRKVKVQTSTSVLERSVHKLVLLVEK